MPNFRKSQIIWVLSLVFVAPSVGYAGDGDSDSGRTKATGGTAFVSADKTNIDFSETMIDGKMQVPAGFFLQGRQGQAMSQMVRLRSKFRSELRNSRAAVKAVVK